MITKTPPHRSQEYYEYIGTRGGEALMRKLGNSYTEHFSRLGKLSAEKRRAKRQAAAEGGK